VQKYSVFLKPFNELDVAEKETLTSDLREFLKTHTGKTVGIAEYEIEVSDELQGYVDSWNQLSKMAKGKALLVWFRHSNGRFTVASEPKSFSDELQSLVQSRPHDVLQAIRDALKATL